jgi:hypothetical protein
MKRTEAELKDVYQTGAEMARLVRTYYRDVSDYFDMPFGDYYRMVANLPYHPDPRGKETLSRPQYTLDPDYKPRDCDDKAILIGSWLYANRVPFRFIAVSGHKSQRLHHVFVLLDWCGKKVHADATYPKNTLGCVKEWTKVLDISGKIYKGAA